MKISCKLVYADKVEPTTYLEAVEREELERTVRQLIERFLNDDGIEGLYLGKKRPPPGK
jgi:hypothetical protein